MANSERGSRIRQFFLLLALFIIGVVVMVMCDSYLSWQHDQRQARVAQRFDLRLEGRVVYIKESSGMGGTGILYLRLHEPVDRYDPRDSVGFFYAVAEGHWAGINADLSPDGLWKPVYEIRVGDSVVVEGRGLEDSLSIYHCGMLVSKVPISVSSFVIPGFFLRRSFEWPPSDSLIGRGRAAHRKNCPEKSEGDEGELSVSAN